MKCVLYLWGEEDCGGIKIPIKMEGGSENEGNVVPPAEEASAATAIPAKEATAAAILLSIASPTLAVEVASAASSLSKRTKKGGFRGKKAKSKFTRNKRTGAQQKKASSLSAPTTDVANPLVLPGNLLVACRPSRGAKRKSSNSQLLLDVGYERREKNRQEREKDKAIQAQLTAEGRNIIQKDAINTLCNTVRVANSKIRVCHMLLLFLFCSIGSHCLLQSYQIL